MVRGSYFLGFFSLLALCWSLPAAAQRVDLNWTPAVGGADPSPELIEEEIQLRALLDRTLLEIGARRCQASTRLTSAARAHAQDLLEGNTPPGRIDTQLVLREVRRAGGYDPVLRPWAVSTAGSLDLEQREESLNRRFGTRPPTHCGYGVAISDARSVAVIIGVDRQVTLEAFPSSVPGGTRERLQGRLALTHRAPSVLVTTPLGDVIEHQILRRSGRFGAWLDFTTPGRWIVEVMATGPRGPVVVALFPVFVDVDPGLERPESRRVESSPRDVSPAATLLRLLNEERRRASLLPVEHSEELASVAIGHCRDMSRHRFFGHVSPRQGDLTERLASAGIAATRVAENLVRSSSAHRAHSQLMESPSHRANILDPDLTHVGIGVAEGNGELLVTQIFTTW